MSLEQLGEWPAPISLLPSSLVLVYSLESLISKQATSGHLRLIGGSESTCFKEVPDVNLDPSFPWLLR